MDLLKKIKLQKIIVGVIGLGYVGLPLAVEFCRAGYKVIGFDTDKNKINKLKDGKSYINYIDDTCIMQLLPLFEPTNDFSKLIDVDCMLICVPTPLTKNRVPNMKFVFDTVKIISNYIHKDQLVILESTTYPGTTGNDLKNILEKTGLKTGEDFYLAYSPERVDPNNKTYSIIQIPKVVGGYTKNCLIIAMELYKLINIKVIPVSSPAIAEASKMLENIYRSVNIALVNELKMLFDRMGIDIWEVIKAAKTKPFGFAAFYPGPGLGGHCIPVDPFYLSWKAKEFDFTTRFIELAGEINSYMPYYIVQKIIDALNENKKTIKKAKILILGLAYKKDINDTRESPSLKIMDLLIKKGAHVDYNDPYIQKIPKLRNYSFDKVSVDLLAVNIKKYDCIVILTDHSIYDPKFIVEHAELIVDTRNLIKDHKSKVWKA